MLAKTAGMFILPSDIFEYTKTMIPATKILIKKELYTEERKPAVDLAFKPLYSR
jgi:hypothetical protein